MVLTRTDTEDEPRLGSRMLWLCISEIRISVMTDLSLPRSNTRRRTEAGAGGYSMRSN
ncbi:MAG: hypothetical protein Ct9H90mP16_05100 [Candidatus Poseidoniales archaeon]|nr:MAG: hypothetical protein Ct9H90mP16_05100 [Candidatus Poseidoniales archaeon]